MGTPAEEFGPYVVYEQLGLGGMATVHRAETQGIAGFSKQVALKRMLPSVASDASLVKSFIREARLASHLRHANVAQTYDLGKVGNTYFIAMELVPGRNLREILKHCAAVVGHMPLPIALNIIAQICDALDYAHNLCDETGSPLGIIHRDVSPSNIIVSEGGVVKLIDFGIAKASARSGMHTMSGTIKGKFGYMAPEYLMGSIDSRADLFAVGVIAHELLANRPLFQGKDDMDTLYRVKDMPILPPSRINPKVPPELDSVIMTALDRNPEQRWQRASALRQALATEIKRLSLNALDSEVYAWIEKAFEQKTKAKSKSTFEEDSEPVISISSGTEQLPRNAVAALAAGTPRREPPRQMQGREVPDEFSGTDGMETLVKPVSKRPLPPVSPDDFAATTDTTTPGGDAMDRPIRGIGREEDDGAWKVGSDLPTKLHRPSTPMPVQPDPHLVDTRRDRSGSGPMKRPSTPHVVQRGDRSGPTRNTPVPGRNTPSNSRPLVDEDEIKTLPPDARRTPPDPDDIKRLGPRAERPSTPPARADRPSTPPARPDRPSQPPLAPKSDAQARTMMIDPSEHVVRPNPNQPMPLGGPSQPVSLDGPSRVLGSTQGYVDPHQQTMLADDDKPPSAPKLAAAPFAVQSFAGAQSIDKPRPTPSRPTPQPEGNTNLPGGVAIRTIPGQGVAPGVQAGVAAMAQNRAALDSALDDLAARGERPSAKKLLEKQQQSQQPNPQNSIIRTRIEPAKRSGASNFLLALLVLIAAGGAAAVVYFALPYLT